MERRILRWAKFHANYPCPLSSRVARRRHYKSCAYITQLKTNGTVAIISTLHLHHAQILLLVFVHIKEHSKLLMVVPVRHDTVPSTQVSTSADGRLTPQWRVLHMLSPLLNFFHSSFPWLLSSNGKLKQQTQRI